MANPIIKIKRSAVAGKIPTTTSLELGELAINTYDGKVYIEQDQGAVGVGTTIIIINPWSVGLGSTAYNTYFTAGSVGIGTTNPTEPGLSVLGKVQIHQDSSSNNRIIFRGQPGSSYRWNIDNYSSANEFRIFREDDATSANGAVAVSISTTGTVTATKFSGDGSLLTGITASGSGVVIKDDGSTVGTATTIDFGSNLSASFSSGTATISLSNNASISGILTADQVYTSNNGNGTNIRIGDDAWLGDINVANTTRLSGAQDGTKGFIVFGNSNAVALGRTGTGPLYYGGNFEVAGVVTASSFNGNASSATYASTAGIATYATSSGIATYATTAGIATYATYATNAGVATALQNSRTFEITGDIVASPISFDGTGNVSLAATIQPNSVALGSDTTGNYVTSITNGSYITGADGGGEGSTLTIGVAATSVNTANQVIARDASGNFSAGTITANLTGTASTASFATTAYNLTDAANITTGTINSARLSGTYNIDISGNASSATYATSAGIASALTATASVNTTGIITASQLSTGASGTGINITTNTLSGPAEITIDPSAVGDNTGAVRIKGDLYVDGTQTFINSTTIELADFNVGIATTIGTNSLLDGAGIGIGSTGIRKTLTWDNANTALKSSENFNLATGKVYEIDGTTVLSSNTLGSGVVNSLLTSVGTLTNLSVGDVNSTGIITASNGFVGNLTGTATYATSAGIATNVKGTGSRVLYNSATDTTTTSSNLTFDGTTLAVNSTPGANTSSVFLSGTPFGSNTKNGLLGVGTLGFTDNNIIANFATDVNSYAQVILQNLNSGNAASADFIVNSDSPLGQTYYGDFGINGTAYNGGGPFGDKSGTYLYAKGGTLALGTDDAQDVRIATGSGPATPVTRVTITGIGGSVGIGTTNPNYTLEVRGGVGATTLTVTGVSTLGTVQISSGIITATSGVVTYYGDGSKLSNIISGVSISTDTTNQIQLIPYVVSTGSTTGFGVSASGLVFNPSTDNLGIGTTNPTQTLHVQGNARITGGIYDSNNNVGTAGSVLSSTGTGLSWIPAAAGGGGSGAGTTFFGAKFDTNIDSTLYIQPTGTLDIVGVGTTTTQITTFPAGSSEYIIHSIHVTNISNGDAEITGGFLINSRAVPASISVSIGQSGRAGFNTVTVGSASSIVPGMAVIGTGNIGETTGIGSTAGFQFNTYVTSVDGTVVSFSKPLSGRIVGVATFIPTSKFASRLPVPVGSAVELLKQPMILNALDSIVLQSTGAGTGVGSTSTAAISQTSGSNLLTVTAGAAITNFIAAGQLIQGTGSNTGIQTNTFVGVGYTPGQLTVPMTRPATSTLSSQILSFTEVVTPQDGALQATIVYQTTTDTSFQGGTGTVVGIVTLASQATSPTLGITSTVPLCYYGTGNTFPSTIQSIRVTNISDGSIYPGGDYPVWVGIGNSDTVFSWLAYNMIIPKNSSIELCEAPKRLGIGQSIFAYSSNPGVIDIQVAARQKTS